MDMDTKVISFFLAVISVTLIGAAIVLKAIWPLEILLVIIAFLVVFIMIKKITKS